jgi:hypothetical protein
VRARARVCVCVCACVCVVCGVCVFVCVQQRRSLANFQEMNKKEQNMIGEEVNLQ